MAYSHPYDQIKQLMAQGDAFVLTKTSWNGYSSNSGLWEFAVLDAGRKWIRIQAIHNGSRSYDTSEKAGLPMWITWTQFGSFGVQL